MAMSLTYRPGSAGLAPVWTGDQNYPGPVQTPGEGGKGEGFVSGSAARKRHTQTELVLHEEK